MASYVEMHKNIIPRSVREIVTRRYHTITKAGNRAFWDSESEVAHSLYVGSYGRSTAVKTGDIDILYSLPQSEFDRFQKVNGNGQSRLLQALRGAIKSSYPTSDIRADGQVVKIQFSDGMKFEVLPAFHKVDYFGEEQSGFRYPDSNMGGNWKSTDPKAEQEAMKEKNKETNGLLQATCRHLRLVRNEHFSTMKLAGIVIDSFAYSAIGSWKFLAQGQNSDASEGDYEMVLNKYFNEHYLWSGNLYAPGSNQVVDLDASRDTLAKVLAYLVK